MKCHLLPWVDHSPRYGPGPCVLPLDSHKLQHLQSPVTCHAWPAQHLLAGLLVHHHLPLLPPPPGHYGVRRMVGPPPSQIYVRMSLSPPPYLPSTPRPLSPVLPRMLRGLPSSTRYSPWRSDREPSTLGDPPHGWPCSPCHPESSRLERTHLQEEGPPTRPGEWQGQC